MTILALLSCCTNVRLTTNDNRLVRRGKVAVTFLALSLTRVFRSFGVHSEHRSIFTLGSRGGLLCNTAILDLILYATIVCVPFLTETFSFTTISTLRCIVTLTLTFTIVPVIRVIGLVRHGVNG